MNKKVSFYRTFSGYLKQKFGQKVFRVSLDAGFTCPNRDGTLGYGGCAYCSPNGSWNREISRLTLEEQVIKGIEFIKRRYRAKKFIAYFQAFTNTYASVEVLKTLYEKVLSLDNNFVGLTIGTRPDCIDSKKLQMIESFKERGYDVWIEYGLQSANNRTLEIIRRGHDAETFKKAVMLTKRYGINVTAHVIIGLPGESKKDILYTADFISELPIDGLKLHNLNIVRKTLMEKWYREGKVKPLSLDEYANLVVDFLERTNPSVIIQRLIAESGKDVLIEPKWSLNKREAINYINEVFSKRATYQGKLYAKSIS